MKCSTITAHLKKPREDKMFCYILPNHGRHLAHERHSCAFTYLSLFGTVISIFGSFLGNRTHSPRK
jgi:hypothetical protein